MMKWKDKLMGKRTMQEFDIGFTPETPEDEFEIACQKVANMLDEADWKWLAHQINDQHLCWSEIMDLVASHI